VAAIVAIGHVGISARDAEALAAFYRDVVGLRQILDIPVVKIFRVGDVDLFISRGETAPIDFDLTTDDVDGMREKLVAQKVTCEPVHDGPPSHRSFVFVDPEGHRVTVVSAHPA